MLREQKGRKKMKQRLHYLVSDNSEVDWIERGYWLRDNYLHSLAHPQEAMSWEDLARIRWTITKVVDRYLSLTEARNTLNRKELLRSLEN